MVVSGPAREVVALRGLCRGWRCAPRVRCPSGETRDWYGLETVSTRVSRQTTLLVYRVSSRRGVSCYLSIHDRTHGRRCRVDDPGPVDYPSTLAAASARRAVKGHQTTSGHPETTPATRLALAHSRYEPPGPTSRRSCGQTHHGRRRIGAATLNTEVCMCTPLKHLFQSCPLTPRHHPPMAASGGYPTGLGSQPLNHQTLGESCAHRSLPHLQTDIGAQQIYERGHPSVGFTAMRPAMLSLAQRHTFPAPPRNTSTSGTA